MSFSDFDCVKIVVFHILSVCISVVFSVLHLILLNFVPVVIQIFSGCSSAYGLICTVSAFDVTSFSSQ